MNSIPTDISEDIIIIGFGGTAPTPVLELVSNAVSSNEYQSIKPIRSQSMEYELLKAPYRTFLNNNTKSSGGNSQLIIYNLPTSLTEYVSTTIQNEVSYIKSVLYSSLQSTNNNNSKKKKILITYDSSTNQFLGISSLLSSQIINELSNCGLSNSSTKLTLQQLAKFDTEAASLNSNDVVILIGGGGREHALSVSLANSPLVKQVICVPGNGGMICEGGKIVNATVGMLNGNSDSEALTKSDNETIVQLVKSTNANMVVVGPEQPLVDGIVDVLAKECSGVRVFGPTMAAAELEASKAFTKDFLQQHNIPTAKYRNFTNVNEAISYVKSLDPTDRQVVKASGLAAGKGVLLPTSPQETINAVNEIMYPPAMFSQECILLGGPCFQTLLCIGRVM